MTFEQIHKRVKVLGVSFYRPNVVSILASLFLSFAMAAAAGLIAQSWTILGGISGLFFGGIVLESEYRCDNKELLKSYGVRLVLALAFGLVGYGINYLTLKFI